MTTTKPSKPTVSPAARDEKQPRLAYLRLKNTIVLPRDAVKKGGPVPALVKKGRWPLAVWLILVASAKPDDATVNLEFCLKFATRCLGLSASPRGTASSMVSRILDRLEDAGLIIIADRRHGHTVVKLLALDGKGGSYAMPNRSQTKVVHLPSGLFANGWHRVLTAPQLAALLIAYTEEAYQFNKIGTATWAKSRDKISRDYGIAPSTWTSAKKELRRWGLLDWDLPKGIGAYAGREVPAAPVDVYRNYRSILEKRPDEVPQYAAFSTPITVKAPGTRDPLRLQRQQRVELPRNFREKVVPIESVKKRR